jgi:hypothetical protein
MSLHRNKFNIVFILILSDILKIFLPLVDEPLSLARIQEIIEREEDYQRFRKSLFNEPSENEPMDAVATETQPSPEQ